MLCCIVSVCLSSSCPDAFYSRVSCLVCVVLSALGLLSIVRYCSVLSLILYSCLGCVCISLSCLILFYLFGLMLSRLGFDCLVVFSLDYYCLLLYYVELCCFVVSDMFEVCLVLIESVLYIVLHSCAMLHCIVLPCLVVYRIIVF